jgi:nitrogen fixation protein NifB
VKDPAVREHIRDHPCYCEQAARHFARVHLAVAPRCNIQCRYCDRRYDCANESRPGVTSERLMPEQALLRVGAVRAKVPQLTIVGIAGPGDPLANPQQTFETFALVANAFPDLKLCLSTNGLALPEHLDDIEAHRVGYVTLTINAIDPAIGREIYAWVHYEGVTYRGEEAATLLWSRQQIGLKGLVERDVLVKVNTVLIPGVNDQHILDVAREVKSLGALMLNVMPLIPVSSSAFANRRPPSVAERHDVVQACAPVIRIMRHCCQCRADAVGLLGQDRSAEFSREIVECLSVG